MTDRPTGPQSRRVLAIVAAMVAVFFFLAWRGLAGLGDDPFAAPRAASTPSPATPTSSAPTPSDSATPSSSPTPSASPTSLDVRGATGLDPQGDGEERSSAADQAVDKDPDTSWTSETYRTARFGGLKKGVGLRLDLDGSQEVHQVELQVGGSGSTVQLRRADGDSVSDDVLAQQRDASGTVTLKPSSTVRADELVLWFTRAAQTGGGYRVEVAEVAVS
ncbi:MAG TPA: hypothetical protein VKB14_12475 [Actinomycetales bacterium]|nr:hypothetical protein [Actinomycetales bacterium]